MSIALGSKVRCATIYYDDIVGILLNTWAHGSFYEVLREDTGSISLFMEERVFTVEAPCIEELLLSNNERLRQFGVALNARTTRR